VIDAAGAIYVIGGAHKNGWMVDDTYYNDVWVSNGNGASCTQGVLPGGLQAMVLCVRVYSS
jgi:hypothetical protein